MPVSSSITRKGWSGASPTSTVAELPHRGLLVALLGFDAAAVRIREIMELAPPSHLIREAPCTLLM